MLALGAEYMLIDEAMPIMAPEMQMRNSFMLMATVSLPLFRSQFKGNYEEMQNSKKEAEYQRNSVEAQLQRDFEIIESTIRQLEKDVILYGETLLQKLNQLIALQEEVMKTSSTVSLQNWLQLQRRKLTLRERYLQSFTDLHKSQYSYFILAPFN